MIKKLLIIALMLFSSSPVFAADTLDINQATITSEIGFSFANSTNLNTGQSFRSGSGDNLTKASFGFKRVGTRGGVTIYLELYAASGGVPTGAVLATSDTINFNDVSTTAALVDFTFSGANRYDLTSGSDYAIVVRMSDETDDASNYISTYGVTSSALANGQWTRKEGGTWNATYTDYDAGIRTYTDVVVARRRTATVA